MFAGEPGDGGLCLETCYPDLRSYVNFLTSFTQILRRPLRSIHFYRPFYHRVFGEEYSL